MSSETYLTVNNRSLNLQYPITNVTKCCMIGCVLFP